MKENLEIRNSAKQHGFTHWEIAERLGVSEQTFCRMMRRELPADKRECILREIEQMAEARKEQAVNLDEA